MTQKAGIGVAVVGVGRIGKTHLDAIRLNPDTTRLVAVVDEDESRARSAAEESNTRFYTSVEAALDDRDIQAMVVCLPNYLHRPVGLQIMESGRHVLMDKPMAMNLAEGEEMVGKAQEK
ncbi:MAG: Gfo/Idh/MocA family oxidoreductase, partial [candidate division NC10 bacterium]